MGGPPPLPSIDQNLGLVMAARLRHGAKFSLKSLTFGHFLYKNVQNASPDSSAPGPRLGFRALTMVPPPPLANPGSATAAGAESFSQ